MPIHIEQVINACTFCVQTGLRPIVGHKSIHKNITYYILINYISLITQKSHPDIKPIDLLKRERKKEKDLVDQLNNAINEQRRKMLIEENELEERKIKRLEKQLGLNKSKSKSRVFTDDGLDCIFFMVLFTVPLILPLFFVAIFYTVKDRT